MRIALVLAVLVQSAVGQTTTPRISAEPPLSPADLAQLEAAVRANPSDKGARVALLRQYMNSEPPPGGVRSPYQADRLAQILYWIENYPSDPVASSALTWVPSAEGPFADAADHAAVRSAWMRAVDRSRSDADVLLNAARYIHREHPEDAEQLLSGAVDRDPANRRIGANLGFLYALDVLGISGAMTLRPESDRERMKECARSELDRSRNVFVIAGAGTALPNLIPRTALARDPNAAPPVFEFASALMQRARELAPEELNGPMPLIREFQEFQQRDAGPVTFTLRAVAVSPAPGATPAAAPNQIRVGGTVQAAKLIEKPDAPYPPLARQARIQGVVRFNIMIGRDGTVENVTLVSGHPLLVPAATEAVRGYRYQPTLLNGSPVQVVTQVDVPFLFEQ